MTHPDPVQSQSKSDRIARSTAGATSASTSTTVTPSADSAAIFSAADSATDRVTAPAWPKRRPGGSDRPTMSAVDRDAAPVNGPAPRSLDLDAAARLTDEHDHSRGDIGQEQPHGVGRRRRHDRVAPVQMTVVIPIPRASRSEITS